jgi:hypothetical protein
MRNPVFCIVFFGIVTFATAAVTLNVYESDGVTLFDHRNIRVGTELKLIVSSDSNDLWSGGLFLDTENRNLGCLSGSGYNPNTRDWGDCHYSHAGSEPYVCAWEDSLIQGFDLFTSLEEDAEPGDWFVVDYVALAPGEPNVGFYDYAASWYDPNAFVFLHQVPKADFNTDGIVNLLDYSLLASCWLEENCTDPEGCLRADMDGDAAVDVNDLFLFADSWLWCADPNSQQSPPYPYPTDPEPDPNLIYSVVDANGLAEITMAIGESITLYVDMDSIDPNGVWAFDVEVDLSDPALGFIDNTAYDPNNPPGEGTARILAGPNRWEMFDRWGPGYLQQEGISLTGVSASGAFDDGHLASFVYTSQATGDVILNLIDHGSLGTSGQNQNPTLMSIVIHQYDPFEGESMMISSLSMDASSTDGMTASADDASALSMETSPEIEPTTPSVSPEEMVQFLEDIWNTDPEFQNMIDEKEWKEFIRGVEKSYSY